MKKMIIKGVGNFLVKMYNEALGGEEIVTLGTLQDLKITLNTEIDDIFGGDGLFAIDTLVKSKSIEVTATDAKFDLNTLKLMNGNSGATGSDDEYVWVLNEMVKADATSGEVSLVKATFPSLASLATFTLHATPDFMIREKVSGKLYVEAATAVAGTSYEFDDVAKTLTFTGADKGKEFIISFKRSDSSVDVYALLKDEVPFAVHVIHSGVYVQKDGSKAGIETELYQCRAKGAFTIDAARATASTSSVSLTVLDPERSDKRLGTIKRFTLA
jgi:hypothetical protein